MLQKKSSKILPLKHFKTTLENLQRILEGLAFDRILALTLIRFRRTLEIGAKIASKYFTMVLVSQGCSVEVAEQSQIVLQIFLCALLTSKNPWPKYREARVHPGGAQGLPTCHERQNLNLFSVKLNAVFTGKVENLITLILRFF